ncbi:uncharacterized protein LOC127641958 [Xyrauchen texanus]|uniref:uncharacterized protein LOC127641958 n=1 Tax=Xyrauchen texanus TaxID=154827 RepID=UPI0022429954|nr:uncharacterized protein LOC127641958 [Xyrauchen texanus]
MAFLNPSNRLVYCLLCCKPQTKIAQHLKTSCLKDADDQFIEEEVLRAKQSQRNWAREARTLNISEVREIVKEDPSCDSLAVYFKEKGFFITESNTIKETDVLALANVEMANVQDWNDRTSEGDKVLINLSEKNILKLSKEEESWFDCYFSHIRPGYLKNQPPEGDDRDSFFLGASGLPLTNPTADGERLRLKYTKRQQEGAATPEELPGGMVVNPASSSADEGVLQVQESTLQPAASAQVPFPRFWGAFEDLFPVTLHGTPDKAAGSRGRL